MPSVMPQTDSFTFGDHDMKTEFGIWMTKSDPLLPTQRQQFVTVPFRDGSHEFKGDYYDNRQISVDCDTRNAMTRHQLRLLVKLFNIKSRIRFWDEPDVYYYGKIYQDGGFNDLCRFIREFTLTFICDPFAYGDIVEKPLPTTFAGANAYQGTARTPTRLEITNVHPSQAITNLQLRIRTRNQEVDPTKSY